MKSFASVMAHGPKLTDGEFVTPQPSLAEIVREHYRRLDVSGDGQVLADRYIERLGDYAASEDSAQATAAPEPEPAPRSDADGRTSTAGEPRPMGDAARDPLEGLRSIGLDLRIGGVDVMGGIETSLKGGSALPLVTGLAGVLIGALAKGEAKKG